MFKHLMITTVLIGMLMGITVDVAAAGKANWKRGRVYFRMVCTDCHKTMNNNVGIPPNGRTIAEWNVYFDAGKHDASGKSENTINYYISKAYRESIKDKNKAAKKLLKMTDDALLGDVRAFAIHGAKDSDTPASCN